MLMIDDSEAYNIYEVQEKIHTSCIKAGWYSDLETGESLDRNVGEMLALIHSEISEALEGHRKGGQDKHLPHRDTFEVELADAVIRIFDLAGYLNYDIGFTIQEKFEYNQTRPDHKIGNRRKAGGKKI